MKAAYMYGGEQAVFETKEVDKMKYFGDPGLVLLGFKPRETLKFKLNLRNACFITPNEEQYTGSTCLLSNLAQVMIDKGQIGIARLIALKRSLPRLVAILPQVPSLTSLSSSTTATTPLGFHLIYLPYADDIRHIDSDLAPVGKLVSPDLIQDMKDVIDLLTIDAFIKPNPELGRFYAGLRSVALDLDEMEVVEDEAKPDNAWVQTKAGDELRRVNEVCFMHFD